MQVLTVPFSNARIKPTSQSRKVGWLVIIERGIELTATAASDKQDAKAEERRNQILKAATTAFTRKGYHNTTMDDIVKESGLSKGAIYWYFKSKKEIFLSLADRYIDSGKDQILKVAALKINVVQKLRLILQTVCGTDETIHDTRNVLEERKLIGEFWQQAVIDPEIHAKFKEIYDFWLNFGQGLVQDGAASGEFREVDAEAVTALLIAIFDGLSWHWLLNLNPISSNRVMESLLDLLLRGLLPAQNNR